MKTYPPSRVRVSAWPLVALLALLLLAPRTARADRVDKLVGQLTRSSDYKVRLSAALTLAKIGDKRAIPAFIGALGDEHKTVRGVSAASLGKTIDSKTPLKLRKKALAALRRAAARDKNSFVKKQAKSAYATIKRLGRSRPRAGGTYVNIGAMSAEAGNRRAMRSLMRETTSKTFEKRASQLMTDWPGGRAPSKRALRAKKMKAFHVDGTLTKLETSRRGGSTLVSCKVSMLLATYPEKSMFGFLKGGAKVQAGTSDREVRYAKQDCVAAVVQDLVARKLIPTILRRAK